MASSMDSMREALLKAGITTEADIQKTDEETREQEFRDYEAKMRKVRAKEKRENEEYRKRMSNIEKIQSDINTLLKKIEERFEDIMQDDDSVLLTIPGTYRRSVMDSIVQLYNDAGWKSVSYSEDVSPAQVIFYFYK